MLVSTCRWQIDVRIVKGRAGRGRGGYVDGQMIIRRKSMGCLPDSCTTADSSVASNCAIDSVGWLLCRAVSGPSECLGLTNEPDQRACLASVDSKVDVVAR